MAGHLMLYQDELASVPRGGSQSLSFERLHEAARPGDALDLWWRLAPHDLALARYVLNQELRVEEVRVEWHWPRLRVRCVGAESGVMTLDVGIGETRRRRYRSDGVDGGWAFDEDLPEGERLQGAAYCRTPEWSHSSGPSSTALDQQISEFAAGIRRGRRFRSEGEDGLEVVRLLVEVEQRIEQQRRTAKVAAEPSLDDIAPICHGRA
jgi:predicted dehydrogenase